MPDGNWKRLGITFKTKNSKYYYDAGTANVFECDEREYLVMENIMSHSGLLSLGDTGLSEGEICLALESIRKLIEKYKICQARIYEKFLT